MLRCRAMVLRAGGWVDGWAGWASGVGTRGSQAKPQRGAGQQAAARRPGPAPPAGPSIGSSLGCPAQHTATPHAQPPGPRPPQVLLHDLLPAESSPPELRPATRKASPPAHAPQVLLHDLLRDRQDVVALPVLDEAQALQRLHHVVCGAGGGAAGRASGDGGRLRAQVDDGAGGRAEGWQQQASGAAPRVPPGPSLRSCPPLGSPTHPPVRMAVFSEMSLMDRLALCSRSTSRISRVQ